LRLKGIKEIIRSASLLDTWSALIRKFTPADQASLAQLLRDSPEVPAMVSLALEHQRREVEITKLVKFVDTGAVEKEFQTWFELNPWVFQADSVTCLDDRRIDVQHIADLLFSSIDGCVDLVELKRPSAQFWSPNQDHGNWVPHSDMTKSLTQVWNYQKELEKEMDSIRTQQRLRGAVILRPHATLILGRSSGWIKTQSEAQRLLNSSLHGVTVMTFDQAVERAKRINHIAEPITVELDCIRDSG